MTTRVCIKIILGWLLGGLLAAAGNRDPPGTTALPSVCVAHANETTNQGVDSTPWANPDPSFEKESPKIFPNNSHHTKSYILSRLIIDVFVLKCIPPAIVGTIAVRNTLDMHL